MKELATVKSREALSDKLNKRWYSLHNAIEAVTTERDKAVLGEMKIEVDRLNEYLITRKQWLFNFKGGGWNSVWALDKETAINEANKEYADSRTLVPLPETFRISTPSDEERCLMTFY